MFQDLAPLRRLVLVGVVVALLVAGLLAPWVLGGGLAVRAATNRFLHAHCRVTDVPVPQKSTLLAGDGKTVIATLFTQNRTPVRLRDVPLELVKALIATEDRRFYDHHGVDVRGLLRAAVHDASGGGSTQGGSTLTMQYVKQLRYYQARSDTERYAAIAPNLDRKIENAQCALDLERRYTKRQILQKYLDIAFFGENSYGIGTAAKTYFGRPVSKLTLLQSAMLVGLLQAPSQYDPFLHPHAARVRRNQVLENMAEVGDLPRAAVATYLARPVRLATSQPPPVPEGCAHANPKIPNAGFFCDYVLSWLQSHGISRSRLQNAGLRVVTTLSPRLQAHGQRAIWHSGLNPSADYILVMPSVNPKDGAVTSMIASRHYGVGAADHSQSSEPLFTAAYAGAGSTYKYFTAAAALSAGAPTSLRLTTAGDRYRTKHCGGGYVVHNAGDYPDTMTLGDALPQSSNTYFVALEDELFGCRLKPVVDTALNLGMDRLRQPLRPGAAASIAHEVVRSREPTFTLGQEPTSALELTGAFGAAANDGVFCPPTPVGKVTTSTGHLVPVPRAGCHRVLSPYVARTLVTMMRRDTHDGTARDYFRNWYAQGGSDVAGKTGTDNNAADNANAALWFVGMTPHLVSAAALVNPRHPKQTVHGLPGLPGTSVGQDVFGAYAATYWLDAYSSSLHHRWSWPASSDLPGSPVPGVVGLPPRAAAVRLKQAGFRMTVFPVTCGSAVPRGRIAYEQPPRAGHGGRVTVCVSDGRAPYVYIPPPPRPHRPPRVPPHRRQHRRH